MLFLNGKENHRMVLIGYCTRCSKGHYTPMLHTEWEMKFPMQKKNPERVGTLQVNTIDCAVFSKSTHLYMKRWAAFYKCTIHLHFQNFSNLIHRITGG